MIKEYTIAIKKQISEIKKIILIKSAVQTTNNLTMKQFIITAFIYILSTNILNAQDLKKIDSLKSVLNNNPSDTALISSLIRLGDEYRQTQPDSAIDFYNQCIKNIDKIFAKGNIDKKHTKTYFVNKAVALNHTGRTYEVKGSYSVAINCYIAQLALDSVYSNAKIVANVYNDIATCYAMMGNYPDALKNFQNSLKKFEISGDNNGMGFSCNNIGMVHYYLKNIKEGLPYLHNGLEYRLKTDDKNAISQSYNNLGIAYNELTEFEKAIEYHTKSLEISTQIDNKIGMAYSYNNLGLVYQNQQKNDKALFNFTKSYDLKNELGNKRGCVISLGNIAGIYNQTKNYSKCLEYGLKSIELSKEIEGFYEKSFPLAITSAAYEGLNDHKKALEYFKLFKNNEDSILNSDKNQQIQELETKYQTEKKILEVENLQKEQVISNLKIQNQSDTLQKQRILIFSFIAGFLIILTFSIILYRLFIQKRKANIKLAHQNEEIKQQKEEITSQRDEIEAQRNEISKHRDLVVEQKHEIESSITYAKRIQNAVLPDSDILQMILGEHFLLFRPKDIVSGDFYWATIIKNWQIFTVADCTGHGVPGAFMSMLGVSFLNEIVRKEDVTQANHILNNLRKRIIESLKQKGIFGEQKDGMDIAVCVINLENQQLQFAGANNPLWIVRIESEKARQGESEIENLLTFSSSQSPTFSQEKEMPPFQKVASLVEVKPDKMPIAIYEKMDNFTNHELQLNSGDTIYLMSDGYEDQFGGPKFKKFLSKNLKQLLIANCQLPMNEQKEILEKTLNEWIGEGEQIDDITLLGIRI